MAGLPGRDRQIIADDSDHTMGNPVRSSYESDDTIWLPYGRDNQRVFVINSKDDGCRWSVPVEITNEVKDLD